MKINKFVLTIVIVLVIVALAIFVKVLVDKKEEKGEKLNITATFYPQYIALMNIIGDIEGVKYDLLNASTYGCLHNYSLTTADMKKLENADVIVLNGAGMEENFEEFFETLDKKIIDSSEGVELIEGEHEENPHTFLSNTVYIKQIEIISEKLGEIDPENKEKYISNANEYITKIKALDEKAKTEFAKISNKNIITSHDTFEYFAKDYGFNIIDILKGHEEDSVSASHVRKLIDEANTNNVKAIFVDEKNETLVADSVAKESNSKVYSITTITGGELNKDVYVNKMNEIISMFVEALGE